MQSSDASFPLTSAPVSLAFGLPRVHALLLCASCRAHANARRFGDGSPVLRATGFLRGETRFSQVAGPSSSHAPRAKHHAGCTPISPWRSTRCCLRGLWNLGHPGQVLFAGPPRRGSCACLPTHRRCRRRSPSQGWLPSDPARSSRAESRIRRTTVPKFWNLIACSSFSDRTLPGRCHR